jgi:hypothetical protein
MRHRSTGLNGPLLFVCLSEGESSTQGIERNVLVAATTRPPCGGPGAPPPPRQAVADWIVEGTWHEE